MKSKRSSSRKKEPVGSDDVIVDIVDKKRIGGIDHFLVKWSKSSKKDSWEPASEVGKVAKSLIDKFDLEQNKEAEYAVEKLVDRKRVKNGVSYLVKWVGYGMDDCTWEDESSLPAAEIKKYEQQYGKLAPKKKKGEKDDDAEDEAAPSPKKKKKAVKSPTKQAPSTDISVIKSRKIINNVLHYEVKFVGKAQIQTLPLFEIEDVQAISDWEKEQYAAGYAEVTEETVYTVEKILAKRGLGKRAEYRVKWLGYSNTDNTWEKLDNLAGSKKMVAEFDKREAEKELKLAEKEFAVEKIVDEKIYKKKTVYLVKWKGYKTEQNTWEPEEGLKETAADKIDQWQVDKVVKAQKKADRAKVRDEKKAERKAKREAEKVAKKEEASKEGANDEDENAAAEESTADDSTTADDSATAATDETESTPANDEATEE